jgi:tetratricopeptide (TPR) repeat protein
MPEKRPSMVNGELSGVQEITMAWKAFPYPDAAYVYSSARLKKAWKQLHAGDVEPFPKDPEIVGAWIAFHAGEFDSARRQGLDFGVDGYAVANKATCIYAAYLETSEERKLAMFMQVAERCEKQQELQPNNPAAFYWHAYALGRYAQALSIMKALSQGIGAKVRASLETTLTLARLHADAHIALGLYHAEIIDKAGAMVAGLAYGARKSESIRHFKLALELNPASAIARVEYANALAMLGGKGMAKEAIALCEEAAALTPHDAMERLDVELAIQELEE